MGGPPTPPSPILGALRAHLGAPSAFLPPQIPPPKKDRNHIRKHLVPFSPPLNVPPPISPIFPPPPPQKELLFGDPPHFGAHIGFLSANTGSPPPPPPFPSPDLGGRTPKSITLSGVSGRLNPGALGVNEASFPDGLIKTVLINPVGF